MRYGVITYAPIVQPTMSFNRNISNNFFAAVSVGSEFELREITGRRRTKNDDRCSPVGQWTKRNPATSGHPPQTFWRGKILGHWSESRTLAKTVDFLGKALITQKFRRYMAAVISGQVDIVDFLINSVENLDSFSPSIAMSSIMSSSTLLSNFVLNLKCFKSNRLH
jgi:hypothetical protein